MNKILYVGGEFKSLFLPEDSNFQIEYVQNGMIAINAVQTQDYTAIILEDKLPLMSVSRLTDELIRLNNSIPVISFVRSAERREQFLNDFGHGLFGWFEPEKYSQDGLLVLMRDARRFHNFFSELSNRDKKDFTTIGYGDVVGVSRGMIDLYKQLNQIRSKDVTVLLTGESGTGKNIIANMLHQKGIRRDKPFVAVNCPAIPTELLESELFGHEKGAFTGAIERTDGKFLMANGGTIFLDEIGDMSPSLQAKILRVLESGEMERVGSSKTIKVDVRIISATNQDLEQKINKGDFRSDLYHRLNVFPIRVPSLRDRTADIPVTAMFILKKLVSKHNTKVRYFSGSCINALKSYSWPGNVRELENIMERAVLLNDFPVLKKKNIIPLLNDKNSLGSTDKVQNQIPQPELDVVDSVEPVSNIESKQISPESGSSFLTHNGKMKTLKQLECEAILAGLKMTNWNMTLTSHQLGISRMTLYRKIDQHGLKKNG
tara:strand:- start:499 stop:1962 length:1464 start_codon:yes stop_codon:yes gene_type:complete